MNYCSVISVSWSFCGTVNFSTLVFCLNSLIDTNTEPSNYLQSRALTNEIRLILGYTVSADETQSRVFFAQGY